MNSLAITNEFSSHNNSGNCRFCIAITSTLCLKQIQGAEAKSVQARTNVDHCRELPEVRSGCKIESGTRHVGGGVGEQEEHGGGWGNGVEGTNQKHKLKHAGISG